MNRKIVLGQTTIGPGHKPFIIAEMSGNHNQSLERALQIVDSAADTGVDALKIQTYTADTMTLDISTGDFFISDPKSLWAGTSLYKLYQDAHTPWEWHQPIFDRCRERGILGFSTPFDASAVDFLESLEVPFYKIASFELTDIPLIERVARTGKPIIMSTGMGTEDEIHEAVDAARAAGAQDLVLLKCTSTYPASAENTNILTIPEFQRKFAAHVGLSDHTLGIGVAVASVALGACVIEKHFTLCRADGGVDSAFSMEPQEMRDLVAESKRAWQALGHVNFGPTAKEKGSLQYRRSIYVAEDVSAGETFTGKNLRIIRPGHGLPPKYLTTMLGKKAKNNIAKGTALSWDLVE